MLVSLVMINIRQLIRPMFCLSDTFVLSPWSTHVMTCVSELFSLDRESWENSSREPELHRWPTEVKVLC